MASKSLCEFAISEQLLSLLFYLSTLTLTNSYTHTKMRITEQGPQSIVVCGPSGSGKSTLLRRLLSEFKDIFTLTVSHTTRQPRKGELNGRDYHFVKPDEMARMIEQREFIEYTQFSGNYYGTSKRAIINACNQSKNLILEVDIEGVKALSSIREFKPIFIFIKPPSKQALFERLSARATETVEAVSQRLDRADAELAFVDSGFVHFDLVLVNDKIDDTYKDLKHFLCLSN